MLKGFLGSAEGVPSLANVGESSDYISSDCATRYFEILKMVEAFAGTFLLQHTDDTFDDYMKALGVGMMTRVAAKTTKPTVTCAVNPDGSVLFKTESALKSQNLNFKLNEEFEEDTLDGRKTKTKFYVENGKLIQCQKATKADEKDSTIIREMKGDEMIATMKCDNIVCTRTYKRK
uniref:Lipocalin/cytosolic fatty-acid binding domain-containing protein n=1 Tax=Romanomermis culicivorax TaxID=13658 RepID=A0A915KMC2_ROMCU